MQKRIRVSRVARANQEANPANRFKSTRLNAVLLGALLFVASGGALVWSQTASSTKALAPVQAATRPLYDIDAHIDTRLLTLLTSTEITIPANASDPLRDAVFFLYANSDGVGGANVKHPNLLVDEVKMGGESVPFTLQGAVLKVELPQPQSAPFTLQIKTHGVIPRAPAGAAGGGMLGLDISGLFGVGGKKEDAPKNTDYGLYTYGSGILSLGSFWYPALAVRQNKGWQSAAPEGLGDVAFSEMSDFQVRLNVPRAWKIVAPGAIARDERSATIAVRNVREFAILMSEEFVSKSRQIEVAGRPVRVEASVLKPNAAKLDQTLDIAAKSLQVFGRRFGAYPYEQLRVVEAPLRGGAGGMEYSGVIGIASMLYGDFSKQLGGLVSTLNLPGADALLKDFGDEATGAGASPANDLLGGVLGQQKEMWDSTLEMTIAHEVAHQWWAIGVGSDSQRHPFVDESLTNWSALLYFEDRYGRERAEKMSELHLKTSFSMGTMLGGGDKAANLPTASYTNNLQYGAVIYGKGALFYSQLRALIGDEAFFGALKTYYAKYQNRIADADDLKNLIIASSPAKKSQIEALYKRWVDEAHGSEDIGAGLGDAFGGLDLGGILGGLMGSGAGAIE